MPTAISVTISAQDNASATLDKVRQQLEMFPTFARNVDAVGGPVDRASRSFAGLDVSVSRATRAVRGLTVPLISELSPALGGTASAMGQVVSSSLLLGTGLGVVTIAAAGLAGLLGGKLIQSYLDAKQAAENWARAVEVSDVAALTAGVEREAEAVRRLAKELRELEALGQRARGEARGGGPEAAGIAAASESQVRSASEAAREAKRAELDKAQRDLEGARAAQSIGAGFADMTKPWLAASEQITKVRQAETDALKKIRAEFAKFEDATLAGSGGWGFSATEFEQARQAVEGSRERDVARDRAATESLFALDEIPPGMGLSSGDVERVGSILTKLDQDRIRIMREALDVLRDTATLQLEAVGLSREETRVIEEGAIARQHAFEIELAGDDLAKQRLADLRAGTGLRRIAEREEPLPGLRRGLADIEADWGATGLRMQAVAQQTGSGMFRALDDSFFSAATGRFKEFPDIARRLGEDVVRAFTGELSKLVTSAVFGQLRGALDSIFPGGASGTSPFGAGSGGGPPGYAAGGGSGGGPLLTESGRPLSNAEISAAYEASGDAGVRALRSGDAAVIGGEFVQAGAGLEQVTAGAGMLARPAATGFTWRQGVGIAGSAALLGLTAYGATGAQTTSDVVTSAAGGALAGAALGGQLGAQIGSGYGGTGAAAGAVLGAAISTTIALLAKQEADKQTKKERQAAEVARAAGAGADLVSSASQSQSLPDFYRRVTAFGSGYTGGTSSVAVPVSVMTETGEKAIGVENPTYPVATLQDLLRAPGSLRAGIQAGVNPDLLAGPNAATSAALQAIAQDLVDQFREAEMGVGLTQEDQIGGLTRRTTFPASRADMLDPTRDVEIDELAFQALSADDQAMLLLETMSRVAVEQDFVSTISDGATGQIVSITRMARSTTGLPPGPPVPPPPGVPAEAIPAVAAAVALNLPRSSEPPPRATRQMIPETVYQQSGEGGMDVETGRMIPVGPVIPPSPEELAAYSARTEEFYTSQANRLTPEERAALAPLTTAQVGALVAQGRLSRDQVVALVRAGLLPNVRESITETMEAINTIVSGGDSGPVTGPDTGFTPSITGYDPSLFGMGLTAATAAVPGGVASVVASLANMGLSIGPTGSLVSSDGSPVAFTGVTGTSPIAILGNIYNGLLGVLGSDSASPSFVGSVGVASGVNANLGTEFAGLAPTNMPIALAGLNSILGTSSPNMGLYSGLGGLPSTFSGYAFGFGPTNPDATNFGVRPSDPTSPNPTGVSPTTGLPTTGDPQGEGTSSSDPGAVGDTSGTPGSGF